MNKKMLIVLSWCFCFSQEIFTEYLVLEQDTIDVFSYQIPYDYDAQNARALLIAFHQWGGSESSTYSTNFDEEANERGWFFMSPFGGSSNNYNHQGAQEMVKNEIIWMIDNFNIDLNRIYMVGGSMGGAAGMIYSNNHLNPNEPMIAATASGSGILDCERRAIEMDGNNSMTEWFGGNWDEVPFEYHRNSAIYFMDFTQSMHYNLKYLPLYLDFGASEPHRAHAEEMYNILLDYNENIWIDTSPTGSHGFSVMDEEHTCDWLTQFELDNDPSLVHVNLDEPSRSYWLETLNQIDSLQFIHLNAEKFSDSLSVYSFENSDSLLLYILDDSIQDYLLNLDVPINRLGIASDTYNNIEDNLLNFEAVNSDGGELDYSIDQNILWLHYFGLPPYELPIHGSFTLNIELSQIVSGDINQDGNCNIQDIILLINHIIDTDELNDTQIQIGDLNNDGDLDIMDIIILVNIIINR